MVLAQSLWRYICTWRAIFLGFLEIRHTILCLVACWFCFFSAGLKPECFPYFGFSDEHEDLNYMHYARRSFGLPHTLIWNISLFVPRKNWIKIKKAKGFQVQTFNNKSNSRELKSISWEHWDTSPSSAWGLTRGFIRWSDTHGVGSVAYRSSKCSAMLSISSFFFELASLRERGRTTSSQIQRSRIGIIETCYIITARTLLPHHARNRLRICVLSQQRKYSQLSFSS